MVDALPYLVDYPYGCTEQTLNRFLPTVITQHILQDMKLDLKDIEKKRTNLNAQEIGDDQERAKGWKRFDRNPVFDEDEVREMVKRGVQRLDRDAAVRRRLGLVLRLGRALLAAHHGRRGPRPATGQGKRRGPGARHARTRRRLADELPESSRSQLLKNAAGKTKPWKEHADNLDAFVYMVLVDAGVKNDEMRDFLYRDRTKLAVYAKAHVRPGPAQAGREAKSWT